MDTTLIEFSDLKWQRGNISIIYDGDLLADHSFLVLDNENMAYQRMKYEVSLKYFPQLVMLVPWD